ncbi:hypothetical protein K1719_043329 [Acacia pycnantha]|nr:hypothetical protein K1719_043329 [Acacia pycnantha]
MVRYKQTARRGAYTPQARAMVRSLYGALLHALQGRIVSEDSRVVGPIVISSDDEEIAHAAPPRSFADPVLAEFIRHLEAGHADVRNPLSNLVGPGRAYLRPPLRSPWETTWEVAFDDNDTDMDDRIEDIIRDVGEEAFERSHAYGTSWMERQEFFELLEALKDMLPDDNVLPHRYYDAKKILCPLGMEYKKIHACPNDCVLYRKEFEEKQSCPICETPLSTSR